MKLSKKQKLKNGAEFFYLPSHNPFPDYAEWEEVPEGLLLKKVKVSRNVSRKI